MARWQYYAGASPTSLVVRQVFGSIHWIQRPHEPDLEATPTYKVELENVAVYIKGKDDPALVVMESCPCPTPGCVGMGITTQFRRRSRDIVVKIPGGRREEQVIITHEELSKAALEAASMFDPGRRP